MTSLNLSLEQRLRWTLIENAVESVENQATHSWRCRYPDRYGPCECFDAPVKDLLGVVAGTHPVNDLWWREATWKHHGHEGIYGDDLQMQCNHAPIPADFLRDPIEKLVEHMTHGYRNQTISEEGRRFVRNVLGPELDTDEPAEPGGGV